MRRVDKAAAAVLDRLAVAFALVALSAPAGRAQPSTAPTVDWYRGLIGPTAVALDTPERYEENKEVELLLEIRGSQVSGRYFYFRVDQRFTGDDIPIRGRVDAQAKIRFEELGAGGRVTGRWVGSLDGADFVGIWSAPGGKRVLRFRLARVLGHEGPQVEIAPGIAYRGRRVRGTNVTLPFLARHPEPRILKAVNDAIEGVCDHCRCDPDVEFPGWPDDHEVEWKVALASADFLSVSVSSSHYCGWGPVPRTEDLSFTLDLRTGTIVPFSSLFRDYAQQKARILGALFAAALPSAECPDLHVKDLSDEDRFVYHLSRDGLSIQLTHEVDVRQSCTAAVSVPYEKVLAFAAPDGLLARAARRAAGGRADQLSR